MAESLVHKYFGHMTGVTATHPRSDVGHHHPVRHGGESLAGGLVLGAIHSESGLDVKGKVPADALGAVALYALAGKAPTSVAGDLRTLAGTAMASFGFRQGYALMATKKQTKGGTPTAFKSIGSTMHGEYGFSGVDVGEDPIVALAKELPG